MSIDYDNTNDTTTAEETPTMEHETAPTEVGTETTATPDNSNHDDTQESQALAKTRREAANLRKRLRDLEETHASLQNSLDAAHWQILQTELQGTRKQGITAEHLQKFGHTITEFRNEDGSPNHAAYKKAVTALELELGITTSGPVIPWAGYQPAPPSESAHARFISSVKGPEG